MFESPMDQCAWTLEAERSGRRPPLDWRSAIALVLLAACATSPTVRTYCDGYESPEPFLEPDSFSEEYQEVARQAYIYAQMSANAYDGVPQFVMPDSIRQGSPREEGDGLQATLFEIESAGRLTAVVIAFRGTEGSNREDWTHGNIGSTQLRLAERLYETVRASYPDTVRIITSGHSLGGALALQVSITYPGVDAYVFNSTYRFEWHGVSHQAHRIGIADARDVAGGARGYYQNPDVLHYGEYRCTSGVIAPHRMDRLARCPRWDPRRWTSRGAHPCDAPGTRRRPRHCPRPR